GRHTRSKRDWSSDVCSSDLKRRWSTGRYCQRPVLHRRLCPYCPWHHRGCGPAYPSKPKAQGSHQQQHYRFQAVTASRCFAAFRCPPASAPLRAPRINTATRYKKLKNSAAHSTICGRVGAAMFEPAGLELNHWLVAERNAIRWHDAAAEWEAGHRNHLDIGNR